MILKEHKAVFIHIPKTGGTSIEKIFDNNADFKDVSYKHQDLSFYKRFVPNFQNYFVFSFIRNPWDLVFSQYRYMFKSNHSWPKTWRSRTKLDTEMSFDKWVKSDRFKKTSPDTDSLDLKGSFVNKNQVDWFRGSEQISNNFFVGKFENLQQDFDKICDSIGISRIAVPHVNSSGVKKKYSDFYDKEMRDIVENKYKKDIIFGEYHFGE